MEEKSSRETGSVVAPEDLVADLGRDAEEGGSRFRELEICRVRPAGSPQQPEFAGGREQVCSVQGGQGRQAGDDSQVGRE